MSDKYDIFISYSRKDSDKVNEIIGYLTANGLKVWLDKNGIESGDAFKSVIVSAINRSTIFLFFSSKNSNNSPWTIKEVNTAIYKKKPIIPIKLDNSEYADSILFDLVGLDFIDCSSGEIQDASMHRLLRSISKITGVELKPVTAPRKEEMVTPSIDVEPQTPQVDSLSGNKPGSFFTRLWSDDFHPVVNVTLLCQMALYAFLVVIAIYLCMCGFFRIPKNPHYSQFVLGIVAVTSCYATYKLKTKKIAWLIVIIVLEFVLAYNISRLGEVLFEGWRGYSKQKYPATWPYPMLYDIGAAMRNHMIMGMNQVVFYTSLIHTAILCLVMFVKKNGKSVWSWMLR